MHQAMKLHPSTHTALVNISFVTGLVKLFHFISFIVHWTHNETYPEVIVLTMELVGLIRKLAERILMDISILM